MDANSKTGAGLPEKFDFLRRRFPPENIVSMRKAAEARDDCMVTPRVIHVVRISVIVARTGKQVQRHILARHVFRVLKRQINECSLDREQRAVETMRDRIARDTLRMHVAGERSRRSPVHVARKLIEEHDQSQRSLGRCLPGVVTTCRRSTLQRAEASGNFRVERIVFFEPDRARLTVFRGAWGAEPEIEDGLSVFHRATLNDIALPANTRFKLIL